MQAALILLQKNAEAAEATTAAATAADADAASREGDSTTVAAATEAAATAQAAVRAAAAVLQSPSAEKGEIIGAVDALCAQAANDADGMAAVAKDALDALIGFSASGDGPGERFVRDNY